ncbi:HAAS signaling domain-containing protein [Nocardioides pantholopis]|uniref:HAAS signaling domain-containing protein n=1 Tax=Nocardioides pantholopis TaxID=2483798 RepID=UPI000F093498|nr:hypothetical protein [Nocardioides pantholopis]
MNDPTHTAHRPEVEAFVAAVSGHLADLSEEEREELLGGLTADLADQVADGADLGDPERYAAELRAAAGLPEAPGRRPRRAPRPTLPTAAELEETLDGLREDLSQLVSSHRAAEEAWRVLLPLRPAWWVLRAWAVVTLLDQLAGPPELVTLIPSFNGPLIGQVLLAAAVVASVLLGQGRLRLHGGPGSPLRERLGLLAINAGALVALLVVASNLPSAATLHSSYEGTAFQDGYVMGADERSTGLRLDGVPVRNLFAYDSAGQPLDGVQLYDADGRPLAIAARTTASGYGAERTVGCGWRNGSSQLFHVFPLLQREQRRGTCRDEDRESGPLTTPVAPFAQVPPVTSPAAEAEVPTEAPAPAAPKPQSGQE